MIITTWKLTLGSKVLISPLDMYFIRDLSYYARVTIVSYGLESMNALIWGLIHTKFLAKPTWGPFS